jgi:hypothetical protein
VPVRIVAPETVWELLEVAVEVVRGRAGPEAGRDLSEAEVFSVLVEHFLEVWEAPGLRPTQDERLLRIAERDGWRCSVPGCTSRRNLAVHHIRFRSHGGGDEDANLTLCCALHHLEGIHGGRLRVRGQAPGRLVWELGLREREAPLWQVRHGRLVHGE